MKPDRAAIIWRRIDRPNYDAPRECPYCGTLFHTGDADSRMMVLSLSPILKQCTGSSAAFEILMCGGCCTRLIARGSIAIFGDGSPALNPNAPATR